MKYALLIAIILFLLLVAHIGAVANPSARKSAERFVSLPTPPTTEPAISVSPEIVQQGEPVLVAVEGVPDVSSVAAISFDGTPLGIFLHDGTPSALVGIDLTLPSGLYPITATLSDGQTLEYELVVGKRVIVRSPLGIPAKLGGNTPEGEQRVITSLAKENAVLANVLSDTEAFWSGKFVLPISEPVVVTDTYGYTRLTGASTISHKGTDFRAAVGTPVVAMNSGVVRVAREFVVYGKTVVIDHGLGLQTLYMHLSEIDVKEGDTVATGERVGTSGKTGYAESPHLHLSVKIGGISIDPMKFIELL